MVTYRVLSNIVTVYITPTPNSYYLYYHIYQVTWNYYTPIVENGTPHPRGLTNYTNPLLLQIYKRLLHVNFFISKFKTYSLPIITNAETHTTHIVYQNRKYRKTKQKQYIIKSVTWNLRLLQYYINSYLDED